MPVGEAGGAADALDENGVACSTTTVATRTATAVTTVVVPVTLSPCATGALWPCAVTTEPVCPEADVTRVCPVTPATVGAGVAVAPRAAVAPLTGTFVPLPEAPTTPAPADVDEHSAARDAPRAVNADWVGAAVRVGAGLTTSAGFAAPPPGGAGTACVGGAGAACVGAAGRGGRGCAVGAGGPGAPGPSAGACCGGCRSAAVGTGAVVANAAAVAFTSTSSR